MKRMLCLLMVVTMIFGMIGVPNAVFAKALTDDVTVNYDEFSSIASSDNGDFYEAIMSVIVWVLVAGILLLTALMIYLCFLKISIIKEQGEKASVEDIRDEFEN